MWYKDFSNFFSSSCLELDNFDTLLREEHIGLSEAADIMTCLCPICLPLKTPLSTKFYNFWVVQILFSAFVNCLISAFFAAFLCVFWRGFRKLDEHYSSHWQNKQLREARVCVDIFFSPKKSSATNVRYGRQQITRYTLTHFLCRLNGGLTW